MSVSESDNIDQNPPGRVYRSRTEDLCFLVLWLICVVALLPPLTVISLLLIGAVPIAGPYIPQILFFLIVLLVGGILFYLVLYRSIRQFGDADSDRGIPYLTLIGGVVLSWAIAFAGCVLIG